VISIYYHPCEWCIGEFGTGEFQEGGEPARAMEGAAAANAEETDAAFSGLRITWSH